MSVLQTGSSLYFTCISRTMFPFKLLFSLLGSYSSKVSLRSPPKAVPMKNRSRPDGSTEYPSWVSGLGKEYPSWVEDLDTTGRHRKKERSVFKRDIHCNYSISNHTLQLIWVN